MRKNIPLTITPAEILAQIGALLQPSNPPTLQPCRLKNRGKACYQKGGNENGAGRTTGAQREYSL